jgi:hypothetical protein
VTMSGARALRRDASGTIASNCVPGGPMDALLSAGVHPAAFIPGQGGSRGSGGATETKKADPRLRTGLFHCTS